MKTQKGKIVLVALLGALMIAVIGTLSVGATPGHFCSNQSPTHQEMWKDVPGQITFASGVRNVDSASLYLYNNDTEVGGWHDVISISRIFGTNHWTGMVDFSVDRGDYWAYMIVDDPAGPCEFKMGTITVK